MFSSQVQFESSSQLLPLGLLVSVAYDFSSNRATNCCQSSSSPEGDSSKAAANLYQPTVLLDSARTMCPVPDTFILLPPSPTPTRVTSTSIDWPGSIRCGEGKHSPALLRFCVTKCAGFGSTTPPTPFKRRGKKAVNRGWRLRSGVDVISRGPLANEEISTQKSSNHPESRNTAICRYTNPFTIDKTSAIARPPAAIRSVAMNVFGCF